MSGAVICAPSLVEARALRTRARTPVLRTGTGPRRARRAAASLPMHGYDAAVVAGVGGALDPRLEVGDVVVADRVSDAEGGRPDRLFPAAEPLAGQLRRLGLRVRTGPVMSAGHIVAGRERVRLAGQGALAVDMESAWLLPGALPGAVVRVVADVADEPLLRPATLRRLQAACRTLSQIGPALDAWAAAVGPREVLLAEPRSFCAGVERAVEIVERALALHGAPVYVRKQIVHNEHVVADLRRRGAVFVDELDEVPVGATAVFSAHGVSPQVRTEARTLSLDVIDATCPLVTKVHNEVRRFADRGDTVLFVGHAGHEETEGTMGERPESTVLVEDEHDARTVPVPDPSRVSYLVQTTLSVTEVDGIVDILRRRFPALRGPASDDICYATTNRQRALASVAAEVDLVVVVGSQNSSNSLRLVETAERMGVPAHLIDDVGELDLRWLHGARRVGVTAGASAPPSLVDQVVSALSALGPAEVSARRTTTENVRFTLPKEVRTA